VFTNTALSFMARKNAAPAMWCVAGVCGACRLTTSLPASRSGTVASTAPTSAASAASSAGSLTSSFTSNPRRRLASAREVAPNPTSPTVFPVSSRPVNRSHTPRRMRASITGMRRRTDSASASASSATAFALPPGTFATAIPRRRQASRSMLSSPTPRRAITLSRGDAASTSSS
jgi:hypothetical protein